MIGRMIMTVGIFLSAMLLLAGCAADKTDTSKQSAPAQAVESTETAEQTEMEELPETAKDLTAADLPDANYDGYAFRILARKGQIVDQYLAEDDEDAVRSAVFKRNKAVEERYHITIEGFESSNGNYETDALNTILAGDDAYDVIFPHSRAAMAYAMQDALYNVYDIPSIDTAQPWWSKALKNDFEVGGKLYFLDGDISMHSLHHAMCLFFNKRIFDELGFDYPYEMVNNGTWTFDEFAYLAKKGGKDLNGDGLMDPADDQYGMFDSDWFGPIEILYTGGQRIFSKNDEGLLELSLYNSKTVEIFDRYFNLTDNENCYLRLSDRPAYTESLFRQGRAMMGYASLGFAAEHRNMEDDFGIIPWPKYDEDDYAAIVNAFAHVAVIPVTVPDPERTGTILTALAAYGRETVIPAFYDVALKTKYARDDESEKMIDIIRDHTVYDIGYIANGSLSSVGVTVARRDGHDFSSYYAAFEGAGKLEVTELNEALAS